MTPKAVGQTSREFYSVAVYTGGILHHFGRAAAFAG